VAMELWEGLG